MEKQPLIKQGWLRVLVFVILFVAIIFATARFLLPMLSSAGILPPPTAVAENEININAVFIRLSISSIASYILVLLFRKLVDRSSISSMGFRWSGYQPHAATGFFLGPLLIGLGTVIFLLSGKLQWIDLLTDVKPVLFSMGMMAIIAVGEELVFRGYVLNNLMESMNKWVALLISAVIFSLFHSSNPSASPLPLINIFLGGLLLGINYVYTRNLWFGIFFHFTWNFYQGSILGYAVSGLSLPTIAQQQRTGTSWLTGGDFGFEGSVICGLVCLIAFTFLVWTYEKKSRLAEK